jgi:hypothetical protein
MLAGAEFPWPRSAFDLVAIDAASGRISTRGWRACSLATAAGAEVVVDAPQPERATRIDFDG